MATLGRNDPCPCGSRRKVKKCHPDGVAPRRWTLAGAATSAEPSGPSECGCVLCAEDGGDPKGFRRRHGSPRGEPHPRPVLPKDPPTPQVAINRRVTTMERRLVHEMIGYGNRRFGEGYQPLAAFQFAPSGDRDEGGLLIPCSVFHYEVRGRPISDWYLAEEGGSLTDEERALLEAQAKAWVSVWEVERVEKGIGFDLRDLLTGERRRVVEESASYLARRWDNLLVRVVDVAGISTLSGLHPCNLSPTAGDCVAQMMRLWTGGPGSLVPAAALRRHKMLVLLLLSWRKFVEVQREEYERPPSPKGARGLQALRETAREYPMGRPAALAEESYEVFLDLPLLQLDGRTPRQALQDDAGREAVTLLFKELEYTTLPDYPAASQEFDSLRRRVGLAG